MVPNTRLHRLANSCSVERKTMVQNHDSGFFSSVTTRAPCGDLKAGSGNIRKHPERTTVVPRLKLKLDSTWT